MIAAGIVVDNILKATRREADEAFTQRVWSLLNVEYFDICAHYSMHKLRTIAELDFSDADETGIYLPGDLMGIDAIREQDYGQRFYERDRGDIDPEENGFRAERYCPETDDAFFGQDLRLNKGDTVFRSAALTADGTDYTDDYVRFGKEMGFYKLTAATSFEPKYWGPALTNADFRIRPKETEKLVLYDDTEEIWDDGTVDVHYYRAPQPLYREADVIVLPTSDWLELRVLRKLPEAKERRPVSRNELDQSMKDMLAMNPTFSMDVAKRDRQKNIFNFSSTTFYEER